MQTTSKKAKGRNLQQWVRDKLLDLFPLQQDDIRSCSMGAGGEDVQLSPAAREQIPFQFECKNNKKFAVYSPYLTHQTHYKV